MALFSGGEAQFAILSQERDVIRVEYVSLAYDVERLVQEMYEEELDKHAPYWMKTVVSLVRGGYVNQVAVLQRAMELCGQRHGECHWPDIPEECFAEAYEELIGET